MKNNKLNFIECKGSHYAIGRQYGEACADNIQNSVQLFYNIFQNKPWQSSKKNIIDAALTFLEDVKKFAPNEIKMIKGQADGAKVAFEEAFALRCMIEIMFTYQLIIPMCTSFAVTGNATKNNKTILGQNIDWHPNAPVDLLKIKYTNAPETLSVFLCGVPYYHLTKDGLANCTNMTINKPQNISPIIPIGFYLPKIMRNKTIKDAVQTLKKTAKGYAYFHIADTNGNIIGLESISNHYTEIRPQQNILIHANHYETEIYKKNDWSKQIMPCSYARANRMKKLILSNYGTITAGVMMDILRDHKNYPESICRHVNKTKPDSMISSSKASIIMIPKEKKMYIAFGPPCENEYNEYVL
ncbi:isopenicillin-N N-acyltransferase like protein [Desulfonauticus submarinus]|uniref:Isopenicillin-N N-acyltransferase like protein n=1 Tax=Desulfonauticus submarinus TaxID=206665 RepID=A0A1H0B389_9BACT|nr:C45 family peptidase [Desulfonauticus submarinus]SDN40128.1 isopenicillin-N N-acyltransferase like protein [Desulfonauticus submarinus]